VSARTIKAHFIEPMLLLPAATLPEGANWAYELKLDGFRSEAIQTRRQGPTAIKMNGE
jgi:ATP-dependent DNA ligase